MARSRRPFSVVQSGELMSFSAWAFVNQFRTGALHLGAADVADPLSRRRLQESVVRCFLRQLAQCREALIDAGRRQAARLEVGPVLLHGGANECRLALLLPPGEVLGHRMGVHDARERARHRIEHQLFDLFEGVGDCNFLVHITVLEPLL